MFVRALSTAPLPGEKANAGWILLGPRQTGKTTLAEAHIAQQGGKKLAFKLQDTKTFHEISKRPALITDAVTAAVTHSESVSLFIDEVQLVPELLPICENLARRFAGNLQTYLTASSVRKLRDAENSVSFTDQGTGLFSPRRLHALALPEFRKTDFVSLLPLSTSNSGIANAEKNDAYRFEDLLAFGTLPGVVSCPAPMRGELLSSYVSTYLERDIRDEALTRHLGAFARFLELAALASGSTPNLTKIAQEAGLPVSTVKNYFDILEDTFVTVRVPAFAGKSRKRAFTTPRYFFFDTGFRNAAAGFTIDANLVKTQGELLFRNFMTLETVRRLSAKAPGETRFSYWSATSGAGVDLVVETGGEVFPISFTMSEMPARRDTRHLKTFLKEFGVKRGYLVGRFPETLELEKGVTALPWDRL